MSLENQRNWLRLVLTPGISFVESYQLLKIFGLPDRIFSQNIATLMTLLSQSQALALYRGPSEETEEKITKVIQLLEQIPTARLLVPSDEIFPKRFLSVPNPPLVSLAVGNINLLNRQTVCLVGSSHPSKEGEMITKSWAMSLVKKNLSLVQGDGVGVEQMALKSVIQSGSESFIVILKDIFGTENFREKLDFVSRKGLLLAPIDSIGDPWQSRQRLLIAAVDHFVVVEASIRSRVLGVVREAADVGRNVMAVPGSIYSPLSKGCHKLIREGSVLVESTEDVWSEICSQCL